MRNLVLVVVLLGQTIGAQGQQATRLKEAVANFPQSQLQLKTNGPISIEVNQGERAAYEKLAEIAGLNIVIDPDFRDSTGGPFRIDNADVLQAFDVLSARTGSFVEVLNSNTVIVAADNQQKRRDYDFLVLKTFYLPNGATSQRLTETVTTLRTTLNARYLMISQTANAVVMRDTPAKIAAAEKIIGGSMPLVNGPAVASMGETIRGDHLYTLDSGVIRDLVPARSMLQTARPGLVSVNEKASTRTLFEKLAQSAGLNVIFDQDFRNIEEHQLKVDNIDALDALDVLALQTRTFWAPVDGKTILVAPDNQAKRRDLESVSIKTFYLPNASQIEMVEIVTALRTLLNARYLAAIKDSNAIVMRDNAMKLGLAERIVTDLRKSGGVVSAAAFASGTESGFILNRRAAQALGAAPAQPPSRVRGPFSFDANDSARATYEAVAATAGLRIVFDNRFQDTPAMPFKVDNVDISDALDFLALQTRTIWQMMDGETVLIAPDNPTVRADLLPKVTKTINFAGRAGTQPNINDIVTALRTIVNARQISTLDNSIVLTDTAENVAFSETMVRNLETSPSR
jgi:hypothetical protein